MSLRPRHNSAFALPQQKRKQYFRFSACVLLLRMFLSNLKNFVRNSFMHDSSQAPFLIRVEACGHEHRQVDMNDL